MTETFSNDFVILVGASVRSLAGSAQRAGLNAVCVDMFGDADLAAAGRSVPAQNFRIDSFEQLPHVLRKYDRRIPVVWAGGLENSPDIVDGIAATRSVAGSTGNALRQVRDPFRLHSVLDKASCAAPAVREVTAAAGTSRGKGWLLKPRCGAGGIGIVRSGSGEDVSSLEGSHFLQEFVPGVPVSATFVASAAGVEFVGACLQLTGEPELGATGFLFCGNFGPLLLKADLEREVVRCGREVAAAFGLRGCFGIDFVVCDGQPYAVEVNPRITASHDIFELNSRTHWNALSAHLHASLFESCTAATGTSAAGIAAKTATCGGVDRHSPIVCRMIVYAICDTVISTDLSTRLLVASWAGQVRRGRKMSSDAAKLSVWLGDIPAASTVRAGMPLCSIYLQQDDRAEQVSARQTQVRTHERLLSELRGGEKINLTEQFRRYERLSQTLQTDNNPGESPSIVSARNLSYAPYLS